MKNLIIGVSFILLGMFAVSFINIYGLIVGILDIYNGTSVLWGIFLIAVREIVGVLIGIPLIATGLYFLKKA